MYEIFFPSEKGPHKPSNRRETPQKGENSHEETRPKLPSANNKGKVNYNNNNISKKWEKGAYKDDIKLSPKELEQYQKDHKCFWCGKQGHTYRECPMKKQCQKDKPQAM